MSKKIPREDRLCQCGCNITFICKVNSKRKFIHGHNKGMLNKNHSENAKKIIGEKSKQNFSNAEYKSCWAILNKKARNTPQAIENNRKAQQTPEALSKSRENTLRQFSDPLKREKHKLLMKEVAKRPDVIIKRKITIKDPAYLEKLSRGITDSWKDPEIRKKRMKGLIEKVSSPAYRLNHSNIMSLPEVQDKIAATLAKHIADGTVKTKMFNNKPEMAIFNYYLSKGYVDGVDIIRQCHIKGLGRGPADFYLVKENTIVFHDGVYHHCDPLKYKPCFYNALTKRFAFETWCRDKQITEKLVSMGYKVIRVPERDVYTNLDKYLSSSVV